MSVIHSSELRKLIIEASKRANVGHIGSALSIVDIMSAVFNSSSAVSSSGSRFTSEPTLGTSNPERDRLVLSKGHAALALYAALYSRGILTEAQFYSYCQDGTLLGTHPEHQLDGIDFSTGSLGQGLSIGVGVALAARMARSVRRTFVVVSDAECNEGSIWEAVMFAGHHQLSALTVIVDNNGQQAMGTTDSILSQRGNADWWRSFGWRVTEVNGHDEHSLLTAINNTGNNTGTDAPHVIIANTRSGNGVSYMEGQVQWHYFPMNDTQYQQALDELEEAIQSTVKDANSL